jgi:hypothetical protein
VGLLVKFYTVFLTFSLDAIGWLIAHKESEVILHSHIVIAGDFIGRSLLSSVTSVTVAIHSREAGNN